MDMSERVALITGANTGIGRITALALADRGYQVILAGRSLERSKPVLEGLSRLGKSEPLFFELQLDDLDSVRACGAEVLKTGLPIHLLINNAGLALQRGQTRQGYELAFGVNHLGPFLLTQILLARIISSSRMGVAYKRHGFKSLMTDVLNEKGCNADAVERQLDHTVANSVRRRYLHTDFWDERVQMVQWYTHLCESKCTEIIKC